MDFEGIKGVLGEQSDRDRKSKQPKHGKKSKKSAKPKDCDDLGGMAMGMFRKVDMREMFILWIMFLFIHTELYVDCFLKRFKCATNDDSTMTMKGTAISSLVMMVVVLICAIVF